MSVCILVSLLRDSVCTIQTTLKNTANLQNLHVNYHGGGIGYTDNQKRRMSPQLFGGEPTATSYMR